MDNQLTLEELEQQVAQLPLNEQLKLIAHLAKQLSSVPEDTPKEKKEIHQQHQREADEILALCDAAAELWEGDFDAAEDIRQMRKERDAQVWPSKL